MAVRKWMFLFFLFVGSNGFSAEKTCGKLLDQIIIKFNTISSLSNPNLDRPFWKDFSKKNSLPIQSVKPMASGAYLIVIDSKKLAQLAKKAALPTSNYLNLAIKTLSKQPDVKYADQDMELCLIKPPIPIKKPSLSNAKAALISHASQWDVFHYPGVFLESSPGLLDGAWATTLGYANPPIVLSNFEPINYNPDLAPNVLTGWNFATNNTNTSDPGEDHGTHTAGTIAATGNVFGIAGMGPALKILPIVVDTFSQLEEGIYWSMGNDVFGAPHNHYPAKVLSMSFILPKIGCPSSLQETIDAFVKNNGTIVAGAANNNQPVPNAPPQACNHVIVVAATQINGYRALYSNFGPRVTLAAPGGEWTEGGGCDANGILSTVSANTGCQNSGFAFWQGTSMATPHVAGIAGLLYAINPKLSAAEVKNILLASVSPFPSTADPERSCTGVKSCGAGIVNAYNAVQLALSGRVVIPSPPWASLKLQTSFDPFNRCPPNMFVPTAESIASPISGNWIVNKSTRACQPLSVYENPIFQVNTQYIQVAYGKTLLTLSTSGLNCRVNYPYGFIC
ncbi:S8 family peptidase [Legionella nagasakiensis]|uniref:S8 family peptidase n=1 Tax=Legionella nagasakiensis TaxID=535290 RepID=UPI001F5FF30B|nr:S8 family serine peptidase [Legionella nagasakiensis]